MGAGSVEKALVLYDSKYGNTKTVAEKIAESINTKGDFETNVSHLEGFDVKKMEGYDLVLIGSPNHFGRDSKKTKKFITSLGDVNLSGKKFAFFDTCLKRQEGKATGKMEKRIQSVAPDVQVISPGLSILVGGTKGPITEGEIVKCDEFADRIVRR